MFTNRTIVLGVTGGIAAYKALQLVSDFKKQGATVHVIMTANACQFIAPLSFEVLSGNRVITDTFDRDFEWNVGHISLAQKADLFMIAPATANVLAKLAHGIADDMLTTTYLACKAPKLLAPGMNTAMLENPITQANIQTLTRHGAIFIEPESGFLACGDIGNGRLAAPEVMLNAARAALTPKTLAGLRILVTAGATIEPMDPVRYITNHSTGKMGYQTALAAAHRGAAVTLISGQTALPAPLGVQVVHITTAAQLYAAVMQHADTADIIIKAAAVADYTPQETADHKLKKQDGQLDVKLQRTVDILAALGRQKKPGQVLVGFSMETNDLIANSTKKLAAKNADMIIANSLAVQGAGFGVDTNIATIITQAGAEPLPKMSKYDLGAEILSRAAALQHGGPTA